MQRVVEFLNDQMSPAEVLAIEVRQYLGATEGVKTIVPRVLGQTTKARQRKNPTSAAPPRYWDEPSLLAEIREEAGASSADVAKRILDWARERGLEVGFGAGGKVGGVFFELPTPSGDVPGFGDEALDALIERYERVDGIRVPAPRRWKKPSFDLDLLSTPPAVRRFLDAVAAHVERIHDSRSDA